MSAPTALHGGTAPLAALTSVFTPPCPTSWLLTTTRLVSQYPAFPTTGPASCDPPSWQTNIVRVGAGFQYYSPAICPRGFIVGPSCGITKTRTAEGFPAIAPGETAVYCVPVGLTCTTDTSDFRGGVWGFARDATTSGAIVTVGPALQIRWVEADLTMLETHPLTPGLQLAKTSPTSSSTTLTTSVRTTSSVPVPEQQTNDAPEQQQTPEARQPSSTPLSSNANTPPEESLTHIYATGAPTINPSASNTASGDAGGGGGQATLDRGQTIAIIVGVTVVAGILLWLAAFLLMRRHRRTAGRRAPRAGGSAGRRAQLGSGRRCPSPHAAELEPEGSPVSELESGPPAVGTAPNPAELEGDLLIPPPTRPWLHQRSWLRSPSVHPSVHPPPYSPRPLPSIRSTRKTIRESFGEKLNDPASALGRLRIPSALSFGRPSPSSASPRGGGGFWRMPRSPLSPTAATVGSGRQSAQWPKPTPKFDLSVRGNVSATTTESSEKAGWQDSTDTKHAA